MPLFQRFPDLARRVPWMPIGQWPTPVQRLTQFANDHRLGPFYIKREDLSHPTCGGNKVRGLEFLLAAAAARGTDRLLTFSSAGSHHIAKTAWHADALGIRTLAYVVRQPNAEYVQRNIAAALAAHAEYQAASYATILPRVLLRYLAERRRAPGKTGRSGGVMYIAPGGTNRLSMLGHVNAAFELSRQIDAGLLSPPDFVYVALGSLGTAAGLLLGLRLAGLRTCVVGIVVSHPWYCTNGRILRFARRTGRWMHALDPTVRVPRLIRSDLIVVRSALGAGYGHFTTAGGDIARAIHASDRIRLDGAYTAKALDGAMQFIHRSRAAAAIHLFWHTYSEFPLVKLRADDVPRSVRPYFDSPVQGWPSMDAV